MEYCYDYWVMKRWQCWHLTGVADAWCKSRITISENISPCSFFEGRGQRQLAGPEEERPRVVAMKRAGLKNLQFFFSPCEHIIFFLHCGCPTLSPSPSLSLLHLPPTSKQTRAVWLWKMEAHMKVGGVGDTCTAGCCSLRVLPCSASVLQQPVQQRRMLALLLWGISGAAHGDQPWLVQLILGIYTVNMLQGIGMLISTSNHGTRLWFPFVYQK